MYIVSNSLNWILPIKIPGQSCVPWLDPDQYNANKIKLIYYPWTSPLSSVQLLSHVQLFVTPWTAARQASLSITNSWSLPKLMSWPLFSNESALHMRWPKYWSFNFNISPSNEYPGLISFRMDWLNLLAVQGTLKSLLQYHNSETSILQHSAFFIIQLSHPYMTTGKTIALTRQTFVGKVMSLLFHILSRS